MNAHDNDNDGKLWIDTIGGAITVNDWHERDTKGAVVHDVGNQGCNETDDNHEEDWALAAKDWIENAHHPFNDAAAVSSHRTGEWLYNSKHEDDAPGYTIVDGLLHLQEWMTVHLDEAHDGNNQNDDAGVANAIEELCQEETLRQEAWQEQAKHECSQEEEHDLLISVENEPGTILVELTRIEIFQFVDIRSEDESANQQQKDGTDDAANNGDQHVLGIINVGAGNIGISAENGQWNLFEWNHRHPDLSSENNGENHHRWIAVALLVTNKITDSIEDGPADEGCRGSTDKLPIE